MNIKGVDKLSFKRALTTKEKQDWIRVQNLAKHELGIDKTAATIFDFTIPTYKNDSGIGTTFSTEAQDLALMLKTMAGINAIQLQPQGEISNYVRSPYSGTSFSLGAHIIDLSKLTQESYGELLKESDLNTPYFNRIHNHEDVDYDNVFGNDGQKAVLVKAYSKFIQLNRNHPLKRDFESFLKHNSYWVEKDALYEAAAVANNSHDMKNWNWTDQNVFATSRGNQDRIRELKEVRSQNGYNVVEFEEFVQFIADKQQKEARVKFNQNGIDVYGDALIGFSQKDFWAHKSAFHPVAEFGCDIGDNKFSCWSPAIDFSKLSDSYGNLGEAGKLLKEKFDKFFERYNGVRIDAAWQFVNPLICEPNGKFDEKGNKLGNKIPVQPKISEHGKFIINNIILKSADEHGIPRDKVFLEMLGGNSYDSLDAIKNSGASLIHISRYCKEDWGRVKYYESLNPHQKYQNMKPGDYIIGPGTHDDTSVIEQSEEGGQRAKYLARDLRISEGELRYRPKSLANAIFAELFTTKNQFATLPDILGSERRINIPNTQKGNWLYRAPQDFEREYHKSLAQNKGLNLADALSKAIKSKKGSNYLTDKLDEFAQIFREQGPMTTQDADRVLSYKA